MGGSVESIPPDCQLATFPRHLVSRFPTWQPDKFSAQCDTVLSRLDAFDVHGQLPEVDQPDDWFHLTHPLYRPASSEYAEGSLYKAVMVPILEKWERLYHEFKEDIKSKLPNTSWDDPEKKRAFNSILEKYRDKLIDAYDDDELKYPATDSRLLAEAGAVYAVNHRYYANAVRTNSSFKPPSLKFAWHVAGDFFIVIKTRQMEARQPSARRGAAHVHAHRTAASLLAGSRARGCASDGVFASSSFPESQ